jgi:hypothetical protein|tara:strand:+ start:54 stop:290 length:237 start_codon:yes stop_codon:yes gene_type:complete
MLNQDDKYTTLSDIFNLHGIAKHPNSYDIIQKIDEVIANTASSFDVACLYGLRDLVFHNPCFATGEAYAWRHATITLA